MLVSAAPAVRAASQRKPGRISMLNSPVSGRARRAGPGFLFRLCATLVVATAAQASFSTAAAQGAAGADAFAPGGATALPQAEVPRPPAPPPIDPAAVVAPWAALRAGGASIVAPVSVPMAQERARRRPSVVGGVVGFVLGAAAGGLVGCAANRDSYGVFCAGQNDTKVFVGAAIGGIAGATAGALIFARR
jgi:hypothetical protein